MSQRPNPITAIVNVHPGSPYAKYNGLRFLIEQVNGPIEKLVFCLNINGVFTDFAQSELKDFAYDSTSKIIKLPEITTYLKVNDLVISKSFSGIGCIAKMLSKSARVNVGTESTQTVALTRLIAVDISTCKTRPYSDYRSRIMMPERLSDFNNVIVGNELRHFVGIGWQVMRAITEKDLTKYPRLVD